VVKQTKTFKLTRRGLIAGVGSLALLPATARGRVHDLRNLPAGSALESDVCIIGGGPAAIAVARRLAPSGARILMFESGGLEYEEATQALYAGESVGVPYFDLDVTRLRYLGGCSNHWGNQVSDFEPIDFEQRAWIPHSGWPIKRSDLDDYYKTSFDFLDLGEFDLHDRAKWAGLGREFHVFDPENASFTSKVFRRRLPALAVGKHYYNWLVGTPNVRLFLHANATRVALDAAGASVMHVNLQTLDGKRFKAKAANFVIACGGLENPRLLLASDDVQTNGVGNQNDNVGRFFMDHLRIESGVLHAAPNRSLVAYDEYFAAKFGRAASIYIRPEVQASEKISVFRMKFVERDAGKFTQGYRGARGLVTDALNLRFNRLGTDTARLLLDPAGAWNGAWSSVTGRTERSCVNVIEQTPNRASRVTLGGVRDELGMPRLRLDWRLSEIEQNTLVRAQQLLRKDFRAHGIGDLKVEMKEGELWAGVEEGASSLPSSRFEGGHHHTGTTRMGSDPRTSVVDGDCRVHGVANLFIAGSSVFPTLGSANPTATICALAARLADHLKARRA